MAATFVRGRCNTLEYRHWSEWMDAAATLTQRYCAAMPDAEDDDPFLYNEAASVSLLAAAAACAGHVGLAEYSMIKANRENRAHGNGRGDFWMLAGGRSWSFEFKQRNPVTPPSGRLVSYMEAARICARQIPKGSSNAAVAGLIVPLQWIEAGERRNRDENIERARQNLHAFAEDCDYVWHLTGRAAAPETWFLFKVVRRW